MNKRRRAGRPADKSKAATLINSEERFQRLVESIKDYAILMLDPEGLVTTWNKGAECIKGYHSDEIVGRHFSQFYPQDHVVHGKPQHQLAVAAAEGRFEDEGWRLRKDGTPFWAQVVITPICNNSADLSGFTKVTRDMEQPPEARAGKGRAGDLKEGDLRRTCENRWVAAPAWSVR